MIAQAETIRAERPRPGPAARVRGLFRSLAGRAVSEPIRRLAAAARVIRRGRDGARTYYDAAATNRHNEAYYADADGVDAGGAIRGDLATLRNRARYEVRNNAVASGVVQTDANFIVGVGPNLQVTPSPSIAEPPADAADAQIAAYDVAYDRASDAASYIEDQFARWSRTCGTDGQGLGEHLRRAVHALHHTGEMLFVLTDAAAADPPPRTARRGADAAVSLRLQPVEADRLETPWEMMGDPTIRDGIQYDDAGRPLKYFIRQTHPGDRFAPLTMIAEWDAVPAASVIHVYRPDRPGQTRGVPWLAPALPLFAHLRRYELAVVRAAEKLANINAVLHTDSPEINADAQESMEEFEVPANTFMVMPAGYKIQTIESAQPPATFPEFRREILNEIGRCLNMPLNVVTGNSSGYNYASGRLDWQVYFRSIHVEQDRLVELVCRRAFAAWYAEFALASARPGAAPETTWYWPGIEHVDPAKEASAEDVRLANHTTTLAAAYARQGKDWERELRQRARERKLAKKLGLTDTESRPSATAVAELDAPAEPAATTEKTGAAA